MESEYHAAQIQQLLAREREAQARFVRAQTAPAPVLPVSAAAPAPPAVAAAAMR